MAVFGRSLIEFGDGTTLMQPGYNNEGQIVLGLHTLTSEQKSQMERDIDPGIDIDASDCKISFKDFASFKKIVSYINGLLEYLREHGEEYGLTIEEEDK